MNIRKKAFTMANMLIVMALIGIIIALGLPAITYKAQEKEVVSKLKVEYAELSQAVMTTQARYSKIEKWGWGGEGGKTGAEVVYEKMRPSLKVLKYCGNKSGCMAGTLYQLNNTVRDGKNDKFARMVLLNGMSMFIESLNPTCSENRGNTKHLSNICGVIWIDINGMKRPNTYGKDIFGFYMTQYGLVPRGEQAETGVKNNTYNFEKSCSNAKDKTQKGFGCTAWVLYKGNMDYLKKKIRW